MKTLINLFAVLFFVVTLSVATSAKADDKTTSDVSASDVKSAVSASDDKSAVSASDDKSASIDNSASDSKDNGDNSSSIDNSSNDGKDYSDNNSSNGKGNGDNNGNDGGKSTPLPINNGVVFLMIAGAAIGLFAISKNKSAELIAIKA